MKTFSALVSVLLLGVMGLRGAEPPREGRALTAEERKEVDRLTAERNAHVFAGRFEEAVKAAQRIVGYRAELQGGQHWEVIDARLVLEIYQRLTGVAAKDRAEVARGMRADAEGRQLLGRAQYREAEVKLREALDLRRKVLGEQHPDTATSYNNVAFCLCKQGKHADALPLFQKALEINRKVLGEQHPDTAANYNGVALCLTDRGQHAEALPLFHKALDISGKVRGEQHPETALNYINVAFCLNSQGRHAEALPLHQKALDLRRKILGEQHPDTARSYNNVANCLNSQGKHAEALSVYHKALEINRKVLGEQHPDTAASYNNVGLCLHGQGKHAEALSLYHKALDIRRRVLGEQHPDTAASYNNVAGCLNDQGKHAEAFPLCHKALDINRQTLGEQHPDTAISYNTVANCLNSQGKHAEARVLYQKALDIRRRVLGEQHPDTAASYNNMAACLNGQEKHAEALPLCHKALDIRRKLLGELHPHTAASYNEVANCLNGQGKHAEALPLFLKALDIRRKALGEQHHETASSYNGVAFCLNGQGKHAEALPLFLKALDIWRKVLGEQHPDTAASYNNIASCLHSQGKHAEAARHWEKALLGQEFGRLQASRTGFERSLFEARLAPQAALAVTQVRLQQPVAAWEYAESALARGLLDHLGRSDVEAVEAGQFARLNTLEQSLLPLLSRATLNPEESKRRDTLAKERDGLFAELARKAVQRARDRVLPLARVQKQIPADAAVVFWLDALDQHLGCVLRRDGPPTWVKLPGCGKDDAWTEDDDSLTARMLEVLAKRSTDAAGRQKLAAQLQRQRIVPLEPHLQGVRLLLVVPAGWMTRVPVEALTDRYTVGYILSASVFTRCMETHRPLQASSLLVLADPVFTRTTPKPPPSPPHGLLIQSVTPGSVGARSGLRAGDVLLEYAEKKLTKPDDLRPTTGDERIPVKLWREGKAMAGRLPSGDLGVIVDKRPVAEALAEWHKQGELLAVHRAGSWQALPGTRLEARTLAGLVEKTTTLLGSEASAAKLDELVASGKLKEYRLLHLATHGEASSSRPRDTALILAQDNLPATLNDEVKTILAGRRSAEGKLTVGKVLDDWELDADLVVLSACQTGLGKATDREGMLGFTQALMQKGARSVVLSRWKVDDAATSLLMARFYENLLGRRAGDVGPPRNPLKRAEALAEARSWLRQLSRPEAEKRLSALVDGVPRGERGSIKAALPTRPPDSSKGEDRPFAHPYYWAAFVLLGDPH